MAQVPKQKFNEILRVVRSHLFAANVHLTIWEELRATPDREKLCDTYQGFFSWTRDAHVDRFIHKVCVVTDTDPSQPSIPKLTNMIQSHPTLAPDIDYRDLTTRLENHAQPRDEIREVRNRRSSHWDLRKAPPEPKVAQCQALITELNSILEDIWNAHEPSPTGGRVHLRLDPTEHSHTSYVLDMLTEAEVAAHPED